jgi:hypothetical protein
MRVEQKSQMRAIPIAIVGCLLVAPSSGFTMANRPILRSNLRHAHPHRRGVVAQSFSDAVDGYGKDCEWRKESKLLTVMRNWQMQCGGTVTVSNRIRT